MKKVALVVVFMFVVMLPPLVAQVQSDVNYYVNVTGQTYGPYSMSDLVQFVNQGRLTRNSLVWREGMNNWMVAGTLVELAPLFPVSSVIVQPRTPAPLPVTTYTAPHFCASYYGNLCTCRNYTWGNQAYRWY